MKIPWRGLQSESVQIQLQDIFLVVTNCDDGDATNIRKRVRFKKPVFITWFVLYINRLCMRIVFPPLSIAFL